MKHLTDKGKSVLRTWLEIDTAKVRHNYRVFRKLLKPGTKLMAVVKSNAYGHDLFQFSKLLEKLGADWLGVDSVVEGEALRGAGIRIPILVLGYTLPEKLAAAARHNLTLTVSTFESLERLKKYPVRFHLKVDSGMHRQGFLPAQMPLVLQTLKLKKVLAEHCTGLYTHFAAAKNPAFPQETKNQLRQFEHVIRAVKPVMPNQISVHAAATSGTIIFPETHFDLVRLGIGLYGLYPSPEVAAVCAGRLALRPALSWKTVVSEVKDLSAGSRVGYDLTETLPRAGRAAICPVGYWHGYPRALSSIGRAVVRGRPAKVLGRVSMDMIIVDVSNIKKVAAGDIVTLIGTDGKSQISADELALLSGTVNYEIVTRLNPLMRRIYR